MKIAWLSPRRTTKQSALAEFTASSPNSYEGPLTMTNYKPTPDVHPWTGEPGYESISVLTQTEAERDQQVKTLKSRGFEAWIVGHVVGTNQPSAYMFRKIQHTKTNK
jgi:hypothetical protein